MKLTLHELLMMARSERPHGRFAIRASTVSLFTTVEKVLSFGTWCDEAGGFIPIAVQTNDGPWRSMPAGYLTIDGKLATEPNEWKELI